MSQPWPRDSNETAFDQPGAVQTRPRQPADQLRQRLSVWCALPSAGVGAALALPYADTDMMQPHLDEISSNVAKGAHAVLLLDRTGPGGTSPATSACPTTSRRSSCLRG